MIAAVSPAIPEQVFMESDSVSYSSAVRLRSDSSPDMPSLPPRTVA